MKFLAYTVAWLLLIAQWNDIKNYYYNPVTPVPVGAVIISVILTVILSVATFKELTKGKIKSHNHAGTEHPKLYED